MPARPIDIARKFGISTTTLRHYEDLGMVPPVMRSPNGYRIYTDEHIAYFICIREMMQGFTLSEITGMLKLVMEDKLDEALWAANKAQAELQNDKYICGQVRERFLHGKKTAASKELSIDAVSKATGVVPSTIRYWDKVGLISASRCAANNYRTFTQAHIDEILMIQAMKLAMRARGEKYAVEQLRKEMDQLDFKDTDKISAIVTGIEKHLAMRNRAQIGSISGLYKLCIQAEEKRYEGW
ncbi:MAG TPA: MerR family transcriptional regulator [Clostridiales bacterium]|nr:MerR family transcriptional regulator [Clostridiales bacterium]